MITLSCASTLDKIDYFLQCITIHDHLRKNSALLLKQKNHNRMLTEIRLTTYQMRLSNTQSKIKS